MCQNNRVKLTLWSCSTSIRDSFHQLQTIDLGFIIIRVVQELIPNIYKTLMMKIESQIYI